MTRLLIHEPPLQVLPSLAEKIGLNEALVLQQIHYWLNPAHNKNFINGRHWVYNSYEEWQKQFPFWSKDTLKRAMTSLEKRNLIITEKFNEDKFDHRKWYSINYKVLEGLEGCTDRSVQNAPIDERGDALFDEGKLPPSISADCTEHINDQRLPPKITSETTPLAPGARVDISFHMLDLWNETLKPSCPVQMTSSRSSRLKAVLAEYFQEDLSQWKAFCEEIIRSSFLMGKGGRGWRVTLDWILDPHNLLKTLEGNYKDAVSSFQDKIRSEEDASQRAQEHVTDLGDPLHQKFSLGIIKALGASSYLSWFKDVQIKREGHRLSILCPTRFTCDYIQTHFRQVVFPVAQSLFSELKGVSYGVSPQVISSPSLVSSSKEETNPERPNDAPLAFLSSSGGISSESPRRWTASSVGSEEKVYETKSTSPCSGSLGDKPCVL